MLDRRSMKAIDRPWSRRILLAMIPVPIGCLVGFLVYVGSVEPNDGQGFPDEMFWWDEAIFISVLSGVALGLPATAVILIGLWVNDGVRRFSSPRSRSV